jgi:hypothetical protein
MRRVENTALLVVLILLTSACGGALSLNPTDTPMPNLHIYTRADADSDAYGHPGAYEYTARL